MSDGPAEFGFGEINANGSALIFCPLTSSDANGQACSIPGAGNFLLTTDLTSIVVEAFDLGPPAATVAFYTDNTTPIGDMIFNTVQTTGIYEVVPCGVNFAYTFPANTFTQGQAHLYYVRVTFTTTSGGVNYAKWKLVSQSTSPPF